MFELLNLGMSVLGGGGITMAGNLLNSFCDMIGDLSENRRKRAQQDHDNALEAHNATEDSQKSAREFIGTKGFHKTRQWIAKVVIACYFVLPLTLPFIAALAGLNVTVSYGYLDVFQKWPWSESVEVVKWITIGSPGGFPIVIHPVMNNVVLTIVGMFFGNQMVKRG